MSPITTPAEAERAIDDMTTVIAKLSGILEQEAALIRAGRVKRATELGPVKSELANALFASGEKLKANAKFLLQSVPTHCATLRNVQEAFRAVLQKNMVLLATTHAVSETIVRRLSGDLARKAAPQVYGASGRTTALNPKYGRPLAVSRTL
jgi:flagellar biosynthesis/type III secretory pathway chaperone